MLSPILLAAAIALPPALPPDVPVALYVYDLHAPALQMPLAMATEVSAIFLGCEIKGTNQTPYADLSAVVSPTEDYGQAQINRRWHEAAMARAGLSFWVERDRIVWAITLWGRTQSFAAWSCK